MSAAYVPRVGDLVTGTAVPTCTERTERTGECTFIDTRYDLVGIKASDGVVFALELASVRPATSGGDSACTATAGR